MKSFTLTKNVLRAALIAGGLIAAHAASASPDDGVRCASGFDPKFANGALVCVKHVVRNIDNATRQDCPADSPFSKFERMALHQRDICHNPAINIPSDSNLSNFENGQLVITIPRTVQLTGILVGRTPAKINPDGSRVFRLNENADFIFFDRSKTANNAAKLLAKTVEVATERGLNVAADQVEAKVASIKSDIDALGSLDRVNVNVDVFAFAKQ